MRKEELRSLINEWLMFITTLGFVIFSPVRIIFFIFWLYALVTFFSEFKRIRCLYLRILILVLSFIDLFLLIYNEWL